MKKVVVSALVILAACFAFVGCIKNRPYVTTTNPSMTVDIGNYKFIASSVRTSTIDTQRLDTSTTLIINGYTSDRVSPDDEIIISIANYKGVTGTFSIVQGQAGAMYIHSGTPAVGLGGIVSINSVSSTTISGYFSFNTDDGIALTNGKFVANKP